MNNRREFMTVAALIVIGIVLITIALDYKDAVVFLLLGIMGLLTFQIALGDK